MLDINPIKKSDKPKEEEKQAGLVDGNTIGQSKQLDADMISKSANYSEPEFIESEGVSKITFVFVLISTVIIVGFAVFLYFTKVNKQEQLKTEDRIQADLEAKIGSPDLTDVNKLASRYSIGLNQISKMITNPRKYSLLFRELEKIVPNKTQIKSINLDEKGDAKITAHVPNTEDVANLIKSLGISTMFNDVVLSSSQLSSTRDEDEYYMVNLDTKIDQDKLTDNAQKLKEDK